MSSLLFPTATVRSLACYRQQLDAGAAFALVVVAVFQLARSLALPLAQSAGARKSKEQARSLFPPFLRA